MICAACVKPRQLQDVVFSKGLIGECSYCKQVDLAVASATLFDHIIELVDINVATEEDLTHYELGLIYECGSDHIAVQGIDIVLSEWFELGDEPYFGDLMEYLPEDKLKNDRGGERHYFSDDGDLEQNIYEDRWERFIADIRHSHRFFNPNAKGFLDSVFSMLSVEGGELKLDVVRTIGSGQMLYRARTAQTLEDAKKIEASPHTELGPTPKDKASSQRMTPHGISRPLLRSREGDVFKRNPLHHRRQRGERRHDANHSAGATGSDQARLVEPPKFTLLDAGYRDSLHLKSFLRSLVKKMSKPKSRNDDLSYLSSQVVFEYLRLQFGKQVDGLVFPSVQTGEVGTNVVLFPEASVINKEHYYPPVKWRD